MVAFINTVKDNKLAIHRITRKGLSTSLLTNGEYKAGFIYQRIIIKTVETSFITGFTITPIKANILSPTPSSIITLAYLTTITIHVTSTLIGSVSSHRISKIRGTQICGIYTSSSAGQQSHVSSHIKEWNWRHQFITCELGAEPQLTTEALQSYL